jgi:transcriptional regulator with XRE-family HTH domain
MVRLPEPIVQLRRELGQTLAEYREATGLNQAELGRRTGYSRTSIAHIEKARQFPERKFWEVADSAYEANGSLLAQYDEVKATEARWKELEDAHCDHLLQKLMKQDSLAVSVADQQEDDDVNRRTATLLTLLGPAAAFGGPMLDKLEQARRNLDNMLMLEPSDRDADEWERIASDYAHQVHIQPPSRTLPVLTADFAELYDHIRQAGGALRTRMIHSAAQLAALTAITFVFLREHLVAQRWWRTARHAAVAVGDPRLSALITGRHAIMSLYGAAPERVLALADRSIALGKAQPCVGVLDGWAARAQTLARIGQDEDARKALDRVVDLYERLPSNDDHVSQWSWTARKLYFVESEIHSFAGRVDPAFRAQCAALPLYPSTSFQGPAQIEVHRATALIRSGQIESGVGHLSSVLGGLDDWQRVDGLVYRTAMEALSVVPEAEQRKPYVFEVRDLLVTSYA